MAQDSHSIRIVFAGIFVILAAVVRIYSALTNGAGIRRLDNIRAAAGQQTLSTTACRRVLTNGASIARVRHFRYTCISSTDMYSS